MVNEKVRNLINTTGWLAVLYDFGVKKTQKKYK